jgi:hypothetical protein
MPPERARRYKEGIPLLQARCSASALLSFVFIDMVDGFHEEINDAYGNHPPQEKIEKQGRNAENPAGCGKDMDEGEVQHDESQNE